MAHLPDADRSAYLAGLQPGVDLDHRGTRFTAELLSALLAAVTAPATGRPAVGQAQFSEAQFDGDADFSRAKISGDALFTGTEFGGAVVFTGAEIEGAAEFGTAKIKDRALFQRVRIRGDASFQGAAFDGDLTFQKAKIGGAAYFTSAEITGEAWFAEAEIRGDCQFDLVKIREGAYFGTAEFYGDVHFDQAQIEKGDVSFAGATVHRAGVAFRDTRIGGDVLFDDVTINEGAVFDGAKISGQVRFESADVGGGAFFDDTEIGGDVWFRGAQFGTDITFRKTVFERAMNVGPLTCAGTLDLSEAVFNNAVIIEASASAVCCRRTRWMSSATLRLRYASVDLSDAVVEYPLTVAALPRPFALGRREMAEPGLADSRVQVVSLRGVDAAHLVLNGVDLSACLFAGAVHLDQVRLEGRYRLDRVPPGLRWRGVRPVRWTPRRVLAEEHHWRASRTRDASGWTPAPAQVDVLEPAELAPVYRALRKSLEDNKHEPGAADFYYGEMEMRRHADDIPRGERSLLTAYWALSGYGMRASRAFGWLLGAMATTVLVMMLWGLPRQDPTTESTGTLTGHTITMTTDIPDPVNPEGPYAARLSGQRFDKSLQVVVNSVIFRSAGQDLTTVGAYTEMGSRLAEPVLLGLGLLAIRGRIKR
ncbi:pentapeptide repeat-containing protein [Streptomyces sp. SID13726]|uniref:pentapeptide repeat-containing protein n=1 Tax=Streptomyces sp. SID13726 TaxID=2706058 RepID=UPI0013B8A219|nr:pentapeptide repeat-containing protein [Streptomyces sp. SID13726]NEB01935.1 pentapeptide repeat-containing protein [Streptomyces sp. SID13726]